jgi:hypothetical protein
MLGRGAQFPNYRLVSHKYWRLFRVPQQARRRHMVNNRHTWTQGKLGKALCLATVLALMFSILTVLTTNVSLAAKSTGADYAVRTFVDSQGQEVIEVTVAGKPPKTKMDAVELPQPDVFNGINTLTDVPAFDWSYGCSTTAAAMLFGYYDRTGYSNMYGGPTDNGVCPLDNSIWGETSYPSVVCHECPLSAAHEGIDGQIINGHVDDYWIDYGNSASDPYIVNGWTEHAATSTGDFMGTSQSKWYNSDGSTIFYFDPDGDPMYDYTGGEPNTRDGGHGMRLFAESRGYTVVTNFNQMIQGQASDPNKGFTFDDYRAEIDAGRLVLIHVVGHTMLGFGYDTTGSVVYLRDTWDHSTHQMIWGGTYGTRQHKSVTVIRLAVSDSPAVTTNDATSVVETSATLNGNLTAMGSNSSVSVSFEYGVTPGSYTDETISESQSTPGAFSFDLGSLTPGTAYYFRAKAVGNSTAYGVEKSFTASSTAQLPSVTTTGVSRVKSTSAVPSGYLSSLGSASTVYLSFEWGTTPGVYSNETAPKAKLSAGSFTASLTGLSAGTTYYFRAKAVGDGTACGEERSFAPGSTTKAKSSRKSISLEASDATGTSVEGEPASARSAWWEGFDIAADFCTSIIECMFWS